MSYTNQQNNSIFKLLMNEAAEEEMEQILEEIEFDDAIYQYVLFDQEDNEEEQRRSWGGSVVGKSPNKLKDFQGVYDRVICDYFNGRDSLYNEIDFERRFQVSQAIFNRIHSAFMGKDPFIRKADATKKLGTYPLVKLVACFRYIAYGDAYDKLD